MRGHSGRSLEYLAGFGGSLRRKFGIFPLPLNAVYLHPLAARDAGAQQRD
jgi:hypothetical protein